MPKKRGLAAMSPERRKEISMMGAAKRAEDIEGLKKAGFKGGEMIKNLYGPDYYSKIRKGKKGKA